MTKIDSSTSIVTGLQQDEASPLAKSFRAERSGETSRLSLAEGYAQ